MISISFLFLMILSIGALVPDSFFKIKATADDMIAVDLGDRLIENIRVMDQQDVVIGAYDGAAPTPQASPSTPMAFPPEPYPYVIKSTTVDGKTHVIRYNFYVNVEPFIDRDGDTAQDVKQLTVQVSWERMMTGAKATPKTLTFQTLVRQQQ